MLMNGDPLLTLMIFIPLLGMAVVLALPSRAHDLIRWTATAFSAPPLFLAGVLLWRFQPKVEGFQFVQRGTWIPAFNIEYFVGVDGISITMVVLTALLCLICMVASFGIDKGVKGYYALFLLLETGMLGVFCALDFFLFFVFWELMLLPMYFLIGIWGGPRREYAAIKFFLYTLLGSVLILVTILYLYFASDPHSFDMTRLSQTAHVPMNVQLVLWTALFIGFAIKIPAFPFHTWLPDAHVEAPTAVSVILAGVLLKMGTYGILRVNYGILPAATLSLLVGVIYDRAHHREIAGFGGLASIMPVYTGVTGLAFFAAMGLPGLSAFISEALVLLGAWQAYPALTVVGASAVILTAGYLLWTLQRMFLGPPNEKYLSLPEINARELFTLVPLGAIVIFLGIYPTPILDLQSPALVRLNGQVQEAARAAGDRVADAR